ncbi:S8 family serine peptidase [candidate division KSB1 bacterium]
MQDHEDFDGRIIGDSTNTITYSSNRVGLGLKFRDTHHATSVAGIAAASADGDNIVGVAPGVTIYNADCGYISGGDYTVATVSGKIKAVAGWSINNNKPMVINLSIGECESDNEDLADDIGLFADAIVYAYAANCVIVAASGNYAETISNEVAVPAWFPGVIGVGSVDNNDEWADYSSYDNAGSIDVVAPGGLDTYRITSTELDIYNEQNTEISDMYTYIDSVWDEEPVNKISYSQTDSVNAINYEIKLNKKREAMDYPYNHWHTQNYYFRNDGTSYAAPQVSGLAALLLSENNSLYNDDVENIIKYTAEIVSEMSGQRPTDKHGYGRINAEAALNMLQDPYEIIHGSASGYYTDINQGDVTLRYIWLSGEETHNDFPTWERHEVRKPITFDKMDTLLIWGRGVGATGWPGTTLQINEYWTGVDESTITDSSATLISYVYKDGNDWRPYHPSNVVFKYTIWGIKHQDPVSVDITGSTSIYSYVNTQWTANVSDGYSPYKYYWYKKNYGASSWSFLDSTSSTYNSSNHYQNFELRVDVTDNTNDVCSDTISVNVTYMNPEISGPTSIDLGEEGHEWIVSVTGGKSPYSYIWYQSDDIEGPNWEEVSTSTGATIELDEIFEANVPEFFALRVMVTDDDDSTDYGVIGISTYGGGGGGKVSAKIPTMFELEQNFPNPFNPVTTIRFKLPQSSEVVLTVYDATGKEVARLVDGYVPAGYHNVQWDATNFASGMYIYRIQAGSFNAIKRMTLIK